MNPELTGRAALVTGAGRGIGAAIAEELATAGARVAVNDIDVDSAASTVKRIREHGGDAVAVTGDISEPEIARDVVRRAAADLGGLAILVNNAGILHRLSIRDHTEHHWRQVLDVNLSAPFYLCQAAVDHLAATGHGAIVNVCSTAVVGFFRQIAYDVSKGGLLTLTRSLAVELGREGVRANAVAPGFVATDIVEGGDLGRIQEKTVATLPLPRPGTPQEIAEAVVWLASDASKYVTGQVLFVDGGWIRS
ncbi:SDR family NAD(P)-dependent oxidoreductase [Amycolatopsis thermoflava]|uniref:SDR family NAD(P)-dependent oxidoreductase n=1 Tax=Amycolatopsis thermoflava TaxID=84480 RepID=UPI0036583642